MCGIFVVRDTALDDVEIHSIMQKGLQMISHRGPDGSKYEIINDVGIGMCQLRTRALTTEDIPFKTDKFIGAFNGQIYLRKDSSNQYTSVGGGSEEIKSLLLSDNPIGMWAAVISDKDGNLEVHRDSYGIKPLWKRYCNNKEAYCSEINPLLNLWETPKIRPSAIHQFLAFGSIIDTGTFWETVESVPRSHEINSKNDNIVTNSKLIQKSISESVKITASTDRKLGIAVSGGLDSSILVYELSKLGLSDITMLSILVENSDDGIENLNTLHNEEILNLGSLKTRTVLAKDYLNLLKRSIQLTGIPAGLTSVPLYLALSDLAEENSVRVLLVGEGADELWGGYSSYKNFDPDSKLLDWYLSSEKLSLLREILDESSINSVTNLASNKLSNLKGYEGLRQAEKFLSLTPLLERTDLLTMLNGIEARTPFLHYSASRVANAIDWTDQISPHQTKITLRNAYGRVFPQYLTETKIPFRAPWNTWLINTLHNEVYNILSNSFDKLHQVGLDIEGVNRIYHLSLQGDSLASELIFRLTSLSIWMDFNDSYFKNIK